ncbi:MAG: hypothetical protein ACYC9S_02920 [Leptospirales bacterium]
MQSYNEIRDRVLELKEMFELDHTVDSKMWERIVEAIDEGEQKKWLSVENAESLRDQLSELEQEMKALENF